MKTRIAINGMGRIGRLLFRRLLHHETIELVAVNDIMDGANLAYLLQYDSVYGKAPFAIHFDDNLNAGGLRIPYYREPDPSKLPWAALAVDVVLECSGRFTTKESASLHVQAGAGRVLLSTTGAADIPLMIFGHNHEETNGKLVSPGGCMTNCATQVMRVLAALGIQSMQVNMIHSYTSRQELIDAPQSDFRRGRAAAESIIPVPIDLVLALERLFPALQGRMAAVSTRVPVANGALGDFTFTLEKETNKEEVNRMFRNAAAGSLKNILHYTEDPLVSLDVKGDPHSAIIEGSLTSVIGRQVKVFAFFDNEWGYTSRMIDWLCYWQVVK